MRWFSLAVTSLAVAGAFCLSIAAKQDYLDMETFTSALGIMLGLGGAGGAGYAIGLRTPYTPPPKE